jgi:hypothetical protein
VPAAGQHGEQARGTVHAELGARRAAIDVERNLVGERMSDEGRAHPVLAVELRLEWKQAQDEIDGLADGARPAPTPRPHLRADVLHGAQALLLEAPCQPEIEFLEIDADEDIGAPVEDLLLQSASEPE